MFRIDTLLCSAKLQLSPRRSFQTGLFRKSIGARKSSKVRFLIRTITVCSLLDNFAGGVSARVPQTFTTSFLSCNARMDIDRRGTIPRLNRSTVLKFLDPRRVLNLHYNSATAVCRYLWRKHRPQTQSEFKN